MVKGILSYNLKVKLEWNSELHVVVIGDGSPNS